MGINVRPDDLLAFTDIWTVKLILGWSSTLGWFRRFPQVLHLFGTIVALIPKKFIALEDEYLSLGGRITLVEATMTNLLSNFLSVFEMPVKNDRQNPKRLLWDSGDKTANHRINWNIVRRNKVYRDLFIGQLIRGTKLFWHNGFGIFQMRGTLCGLKLLLANIVLTRADGILLSRHKVIHITFAFFFSSLFLILVL